jgi:hypothetical protein
MKCSPLPEKFLLNNGTNREHPGWPPEIDPEARDSCRRRVARKKAPEGACLILKLILLQMNGQPYLLRK